MKFTKIIALTVIVTIMVNAFFVSKCNANEKELQLYAKYACLMDANSGRVLYSKDGDVAVPIASTTKLLTCIIALENGNMEDIVTVSKNAAKMPDVQLNIVSGEQYKLKDLLYSLMLESHNDSAVAIAEHIAGSVEGFAKLMNEKALQIG
ncbi:MAG: D-alanyl-D-alanine carboxypeptidase [Lachnospiraceae bacterium]|nr:D-alanyl-D-alanine carboxypeptidase [Lachnospiraceae bacterium]